MLSEDEYPVYLVYAGGEIIMVVTGILLAALGYKNSFVLSNYNNQLIIAGLEEIHKEPDKLIDLMDKELSQ